MPNKEGPYHLHLDQDVAFHHADGPDHCLSVGDVREFQVSLRL